MEPELKLKFYFQFFLAGGSVEKKSFYDEEGVEGWEFIIDSFGERREFTCIGLWDEVPEMPEELIEYLSQEPYI